MVKIKYIVLGTNANGQHQHVGHQPNGLETRMISSTSTPDLASSNIISTMNATHSGIVLGGSSPDLVSRKNLGRVANHSKSKLMTDLTFSDQITSDQIIFSKCDLI